MIRAIYIIVEGPTEEEFVKNMLQPYFANQHNFPDIRAIKMETSPGHKGGDISFARYRRNVELLLKRENDIMVTSLIDFYKLRTDFPSYEEAKNRSQVEDKVSYIEQSCAKTIDSPRFIPYIQLHEFEGLLFSSKQGFEYLGLLSEKQLTEVENIMDQFDNPELINDGQNTAPSKRLANIISGYQKVLHGNVIALSNEIQVVIDKCPRFCRWIEQLESKLQ